MRIYAIWWPAMLAATVLTTAGCAYYVPPPYPITSPSSYDRAFSAAAGAMRDQGVAIQAEDRSSGSIVGTMNSATVSANVRAQADGSVRIEFNAAGPRDPSLVDRISQSYDSRMGR